MHLVTQKRNVVFFVDCSSRISWSLFIYLLLCLPIGSHHSLCLNHHKDVLSNNNAFCCRHSSWSLVWFLEQDVNFIMVLSVPVPRHPDPYFLLLYLSTLNAPFFIPARFLPFSEIHLFLWGISSVNIYSTYDLIIAEASLVLEGLP